MGEVVMVGLVSMILQISSLIDGVNRSEIGGGPSVQAMCVISC